MPSKKPRVPLTLPDDLNNLLAELAQYQGIHKTRFITDLLIEMQPVLQSMLDAYKSIEADKTRAVDVVKLYGLTALADATAQTAALAADIKGLDDD